MHARSQATADSLGSRLQGFTNTIKNGDASQLGRSSERRASRKTGPAVLQRGPERDFQVPYPLAGGVAISGAVGGGRGGSQGRTNAEETAGGRPEEMAGESEGERHVQVGGGWL